MRLGLATKVAAWFKDLGIKTDENIFKPDFVAENLDAISKRYADFDLEDWNNYMAISVAYEWMFDISETNQVDGSLGFRLPFVNPGSLDVGAGGKVNTLRKATRTFKNQDTFGNLLTRHWFELCNDEYGDRSADEIPIGPIPQPKRILYPITGTIGLQKVVRTFLSIASWEDGVDTFVDELAFTTTVNANVGSTVTLSPVSQQFRLVNASANLSGSRVDLHKVKISLAFPKARPAQKKTPKQIGKDLDEQLAEAVGGYQLNPHWRAAYALCVADSRSREEDFKNLRLEPPEVTCVASTDTFFPRGNGLSNSLRTGRNADLVLEKSMNNRRKLDDQRRKEELKQLEEQNQREHQNKSGGRTQ